MAVTTSENEPEPATTVLLYCSEVTDVQETVVPNDEDPWVEDAIKALGVRSNTPKFMP